MRNGLAAGPLPADLDYGPSIQAACSAAADGGFSPEVAYAIALNETIHGEHIREWASAASVIGKTYPRGWGLFQITPEPEWWSQAMQAEWTALNWADPQQNAAFAIKWFLRPAEDYWASQGLQGGPLVRCIAAEFNAGRPAVIAAHAHGDVDLATYDHHYATDALSYYLTLLGGKKPT